jgi:hypothetical protein
LPECDLLFEAIETIRITINTMGKPFRKHLNLS